MQERALPSRGAGAAARAERGEISCGAIRCGATLPVIAKPDPTRRNRRRLRGAAGVGGDLGCIALEGCQVLGDRARLMAVSIAGAGKRAKK